MITDTRERIIEFITKNKQARVHDLALTLKIGKVALHRQLNELIVRGILQKIGKAPKVFYLLNETRNKQLEVVKDRLKKQMDFLRHSYNVSQIGIFGSVARNQANQFSDIDLLVKFSRPVGFFKFSQLELYLSKKLGSQVDLVTPRAIKSAIKYSVNQDIIYV